LRTIFYRMGYESADDCELTKCDAISV
jgi:hypothetical protein